jgi:hypothetical protein
MKKVDCTILEEGLTVKFARSAKDESVLHEVGVVNASQSFYGVIEKFFSSIPDTSKPISYFIVAVVEE